MTGKWPESTIDHIDGNRINNIFSNLRDVSASENNHNRKKAFSNNKAGILGVNFYIPLLKWRARFKNKHLGYFETSQEAHQAYLTAKKVAGYL